MIHSNTWLILHHFHSIQCAPLKKIVQIFYFGNTSPVYPPHYPPWTDTVHLDREFTRICSKAVTAMRGGIGVGFEEKLVERCNYYLLVSLSLVILFWEGLIWTLYMSSAEPLWQSICFGRSTTSGEGRRQCLADSSKQKLVAGQLPAWCALHLPVQPRSENQASHKLVIHNPDLRFLECSDGTHNLCTSMFRLDIPAWLRGCHLDESLPGTRSNGRFHLVGQQIGMV